MYPDPNNELHRRWSTYKAPEFVSAEERTAYNQLRGILQLHPAEIAASGEFERIRELVDTIERERSNA